MTENGMLLAAVAALIAGFLLVRKRFRAASGADKMIVLGPVFEATALAMFAAEHFCAAHGLMALVPKWLPGPLFWTYFFGVALLAAAVSLLLWICVRWAAPLLALFFLIVVVTLDVPNVAAGMHDRFFWILTVRETCFASGAMVLAGSVWPRGWPAAALEHIGRAFVACTMIFYAIEHFLHPLHVPGVPLEKMTPAWVPAPAALACLIGIVLLIGGIGLFLRPMRRIATAGAGAVLLLLTALFYVPIFVMEMRSALAVEDLNYIGDTMLFAATILLVGFGADRVAVSGKVEEIAAAPPFASA